MAINYHWILIVAYLPFDAEKPPNDETVHHEI
jgi:hypothetical protein